MLLDHYVSAMDSWKGRIDSETDYDAFRWHQWVQPIDLNDDGAPFTAAAGDSVAAALLMAMVLPLSSAWLTAAIACSISPRSASLSKSPS